MYENRLGKLRDGGTLAYKGGATLTRYDLADDPDPTFRDGMLPRPFRMAAVFQHRYTRLPGDMDLSKVIHAYGTMDVIGVEELLRKLDLQ